MLFKADAMPWRESLEAAQQDAIDKGWASRDEWVQGRVWLGVGVEIEARG